MKSINSIILAGVTAFSINSVAAEVPAGSWAQTSSNAGDCSNCEIKIIKSTPHIIQITANNDWIGYAYYNQSTDSYKGASENLKGTGGAYENKLFLITLIYEGKTLIIKGHSSKGDITTTYRKK